MGKQHKQIQRKHSRNKAERKGELNGLFRKALREKAQIDIIDHPGIGKLQQAESEKENEEAYFRAYAPCKQEEQRTGEKVALVHGGTETEYVYDQNGGQERIIRPFFFCLQISQDKDKDRDRGKGGDAPAAAGEMQESAFHGSPVASDQGPEVEGVDAGSRHAALHGEVLGKHFTQAEGQADQHHARDDGQSLKDGFYKCA